MHAVSVYTDVSNVHRSNLRTEIGWKLSEPSIIKQLPITWILEYLGTAESILAILRELLRLQSMLRTASSTGR